MGFSPPVVDADIARARPLPASFYRDPEAFARARDVFASSWQWLGPPDDAAARVTPISVLPEFLAEPVLAVRDDDRTRRWYPNVCTHRAHPLCESASDASALVCRYHGRRFDLDGKCVGAPGFEEVADFPAACDHLRAFAATEIGGHAFVSLGDEPAGLLPAEIAARVRLDALAGAIHAPERDRDFEVAAHWALYVENYLEGFHVPFVHPELHRTLAPDDYEVTPFDGGVLQVGHVRRAEEAFGSGSPLVGEAEARPEAVGGYYLWWFPNTMWNVYPWGLSVNVVEPVTPERTRVRFRAYVLDPARLDAGAGAELDLVEAQDEAVVERVQKGVNSRHWHGARFSPTRERGVHHFHRLLAERYASS